MCVYMHSDIQLYYISVVMSNIGTNMYGGNIGSLMLCVYTCTQSHSCTTVDRENFAVETNREN